MSEQRIRVYRAGNVLALEDIVLDADYQGATVTTLMQTQTAIDVGEAMATIGRQILLAPPKWDERVSDEEKLARVVSNIITIGHDAGDDARLIAERVIAVVNRWRVQERGRQIIADLKQP